MADDDDLRALRMVMPDTSQLDQMMDHLMEQKRKVLESCALPAFTVGGNFAEESGAAAAMRGEMLRQSEEERKRKLHDFVQRGGYGGGISSRSDGGVRWERLTLGEVHFEVAVDSGRVRVQQPDQPWGEMTECDPTTARVVCGVMHELILRTRQLDEQKARSLELSLRIDSLEEEAAARTLADVRLDDEP